MGRRRALLALVAMLALGCPTAGDDDIAADDDGADDDMGDDDDTADDDSGDDDSGDDDTADDDSGDDDTDMEGAYLGPVMIGADNYAQYHADLEPLRPFVVYAWATDPAIQAYEQQIATLSAINDKDIRKMVMFSSHATMEAKLADGGHAAALQAIGVELLGYNTEGGMTPQNELNQVDNPNVQQNSVAVFVAIADGFGQGFDVWWGPIRSVSDNISDAALQAMFTAGLDGVGLQEQLPIEASCAADRIAAVQATATRYHNIPGGQNCRINVQVMSSRCANGDTYAQAHCPAETIAEEYDHCDLFIDGIAPGIDSMAIWASGPDDLGRLVGFVEKMREPEP